jgi:glyoxylase-like metal-dependent hydrolase (beta-lactamase superfamily II)
LIEEVLGERHFGSVWFIPGEKSGKYPFCHSVYIEGGGVLIDPSSSRERLIQLRKDPGVREVWLTHWHEDHFMHLDLFDDLPLAIAAEDAQPLRGLDGFMDAYGMDGPEEREYWKGVLAEQFHFRPREPARILRGGEAISLDGTTVEIVPTPGHTPGHMSFLFREEGVLLLGDYDLTRFGPWYGDVGSSIEGTIASVAILRNTPARIWLASHERGVFAEEPGQRWDRYIQVIHERENKLLARLEEPCTLDDVVSTWIVYGKPREPRAFFEFGERAIMGKHLEKLVSEGKVTLDGDRYRRL